VRVVQSQQLSIGEIDVSKIKFDAKSRDDIPKILRGLQQLYTDPVLRAATFELLARQVAPRVNKSNRRPGMTLWTILVCGVIRLDLNIDYDRLHELVNHHNTIREMLGHGAFADVSYHHQTLKDNVALLTPELLGEINQLVVQAGHGLIKKWEEGALRGRCDSKVAHQEYLDAAQRYLDKARQTIVELDAQGHADFLDLVKKEEIEGFMAHADRQIDQVRRRVIEGAVIGHEEKVFSIFQPHTEWISKGKAGVPVELGVKVCILEDQHQFILHHQVMQRQSDDQVCLDMVVQAKNRFPKLNACSFDKGLHSTANQAALKEQLELVALPRKGKLSQETQATEQAPAFARARRAHSAVESAINALEVHGLDRCPDHGIHGFKPYVALAVLARNSM